MKKYLVASFILLSIGFVIGYFTFRSDGKIKIVEIEKPVTVWMQNPETMDYRELLECAKSPIDIQIGILDINQFRITAHDKCKTASALYEIKKEPVDSGLNVGICGGVMWFNNKLSAYISPSVTKTFGRVSITGEFILNRNLIGVGAGASIAF